tara:strand:+ start:34 stop:228 length:195 start_codon:yes stop_codon:yes gene_type:complete
MKNLKYSINTRRAISKYGQINCINFFTEYVKYEEGANTMSQGTEFTTQQMDSMINSGREIQESK